MSTDFRPPFLDIPPLLQAGGTVHLPGSKSISNRALLLSGLCAGHTTLQGVLDSDDTRVMLAALAAIGCSIQRTGADTVDITGIGGQLPNGVGADAASPLELFLGNAGTAMRPLTAALAMLGGHFTLTGVARMYERPIGDLVDGLQQLGCHVSYLREAGFPPLRIAPRDPAAAEASAPAHITVRGDVSSQFLTALLMAAPLARHTTTIAIEGELISKPYIAITLALMQRFGVQVARDTETGWRSFTIAADACYRSPGTYPVEADASSASYFIALGALAATETGITVQGVGADSIQGDIRFIEAASAMGARITSTATSITIHRERWPLAALDLDCNHIPDAAMTLAVMALYADAPSTLRNIASWRVKETDRIAAMARELRKLGASIEEGPDFLRITPPSATGWRTASLHTYDDHRMAMCLSLAAFNPAGLPVRIEDPACVGKTFPEYFDAFLSVCSTRAADIPVLCVDGPSASGKGTLSAELARQLGYHLLDSGALYRIVGLAARRTGLLDADSLSQPSLPARVGALAASLQIRFGSAGTIWLGDEPIGEAIRTEEAGRDASIVSAMPPVRTALVELQRGFRRLPGLVADGRDMGTVIFPDAPLKVFLTASAATRAERRHKQLISKGIPSRIDDLLADLEARDARDTQRAVAPLRPADHAHLLDNSDMDVPTSVDRVLSWWEATRPFGSATPAHSAA
ncbi:bifunctional 3-phosphoshikimate 1-carboxyvinyltransferase/cytidylate kinase [Brachymonas sp. M4Q-1]|uniref:bifunctional 3-phosphoshikimate 1-carboxyvinyltransferase/cytidylate kinase n=1 Tax=Brachymonas sp. M4Q-1 TaxID=3416906 RepID=UPI003CFAEA14